MANSERPLHLEPVNNLERVLLQGREGRLEVAALLEIFKSSQFYILIDKEIGKDGKWDNSISPMVLRNADGPMLALFTAPERSNAWHTKCPEFGFGLLINFKWLLKGAAPGVGIVINPGWDVGMEIHTDSVEELKEAVAHKYLKESKTALQEALHLYRTLDQSHPSIYQSRVAALDKALAALERAKWSG